MDIFISFAFCYSLCVIYMCKYVYIFFSFSSLYVYLNNSKNEFSKNKYLISQLIWGPRNYMQNNN